jgi:hypothetical protein
MAVRTDERVAWAASSACFDVSGRDGCLLDIFVATAAHATQVLDGEDLDGIGLRRLALHEGYVK